MEGSGIHWRYKGAVGELVTKLFKYREVFGNHFNYRYQIDDNNNWNHYHISVERTWVTTCWPDRCHAYSLVLTEVNENYLRGYLVDGVDVKPQLVFRQHLGWEMVEKTLDEDIETGGVDGRRLRARRGGLVRLQNIVENGLVMRINGGGSSSPTRTRYATTEAAIVIFYKELLQIQ